MKCRECGVRLTYWYELLGDRCKPCIRDEDPPEVVEEEEE
jgi:hypothetical protein